MKFYGNNSFGTSRQEADRIIKDATTHVEYYIPLAAYFHSIDVLCAMYSYTEHSVVSAYIVRCNASTVWEPSHICLLFSSNIE